MKTRYLPDNVRYKSMDTTALRDAYLADDLFAPGEIRLNYVETDRQVLGGAVPTTDTLTLSAGEELRAQFFCERRELGVINVGGKGDVIADDKTFTVDARECVYVGRGTKNVQFTSKDANNPAAFFLCSFPAHTEYPTMMATEKDARVLDLGSLEDSNERHIVQYIHPEGIKSCQLVMGYTHLEKGSVWNTMPAHTHARRCETYMYFDVAEGHQVVHLMGEPTGTRHIMVSNRQAVISPSWSMHSGSGTRNYAFIWAMGGETKAFGDMDGVPISDLR